MPSLLLSMACCSLKCLATPTPFIAWYYSPNSFSAPPHCRWLSLEDFHEAWRCTSLIWLLPSRSQRSWQSPLYVYPAASLLHNIPIPAAAAAWEEARLAEGWGWHLQYLCSLQPLRDSGSGARRNGSTPGRSHTGATLASGLLMPPRNTKGLK